MQESVIDRHMERTARNLLILNILLLVAIIGAFLFSFRYFYNFVLGPFPIDRGELLAVEDPEKQFRYFVKVVGDEGVQTGAVRKKGSQVKESYNLIVINDRLLLVESSETDYYGKEATGALVPVPGEVRMNIVDPVVAKNRALRGQFLPFMLDATSFRMPGFIGILVGLPLLLLASWNIWRAVDWLTDSRKHPLTKALAQFGDPREVGRAIDAEHRLPEVLRIGKVTLTRSWMLREVSFNLTVGRLDDLIWAYKKITKHSTNFIPTGKTFAVVICSRSWSGPLEIDLNEKQCEDLLNFFTQRVPWALYGFDYTLDAEMNSNPMGVFNAVAAREREFKAAAARKEPPAEN